MTEQIITHLAQSGIAKALSNQAFFDSIRANLFSGSLNQAQVDGINTIVAEAVAQGLSLPQIAYVLATTYHETAMTMQTLEEYGRGKNYDYGRWQKNSKGLNYCYKNSKRDTVYTESECPYLFYGRGYVQLTWYSNYAKAGAKLGLDLVGNPQLAKQPDIAAKILIFGMKEGWFTGKKLSDYIHDSVCDYDGARRIVNGTDKAQIIARYAKKFETALNAV